MANVTRLRQALVRRHALVSRLLPRRHRAYRFAGGRIYLDLRESPAMLARALGVYEPAKVATLRGHLRPGMTFVDVGVNKGDFSLIAARLMDDRGRVIAVEPEPENCAWIRRSISLNGYRSIELVEAALSSSDGEATLYLGRHSGWHTLVAGVRGRDQGTVTVPTRTLDGLLAERGIEAPDVVKIDVEGAEMDVLRGATAAFGGRRPLLVLVDIHPPVSDPREVCAVLTGHGLRLFEVGEPARPLGEVSPTLREVVARR
jgi:FkbM family methyltransferase